MNKDTVFGKTGRCLGRLVGAYVFRKTGTDRAFYWRKGLRDEEGGMWQLLQQVVGVHMVIWHVRMQRDPGMRGFFVFIFYIFVFYKNIFFFSKFTEIYPAAPLPGGRDLVAPQSGRGFSAKISQIFLQKSP